MPCQAALAEASRFDDFHRRIAFVMHDIKNLASQLSLLARNAELHADNPEFRADMLVTLRNSADKLNNLLARLSRYVGGGGAERLGEVDAGEVVKQVAAQFRDQHPCCWPSVSHALSRPIANRWSRCWSISSRTPSMPARTACRSCSASAPTACMPASKLSIPGCGMSPDFVRTRLFKPFVSSKQGGFGIGAFEARELVRAMRGRLEVESREGLGSRFTVRLPLAGTEGIFGAIEKTGEMPASLPDRR